MNIRHLFNEDWTFSKGNIDADLATLPSFQPIAIPHDWLIEDTKHLYADSLGCYKKTFYWDASAEHVFLQFDGVYMDSTLYVNNIEIGEWKYGYSAFEFEITSALRAGENEIVLLVRHQAPNSRWYSGAGIYRNVWLRATSNQFIPTNGIYVSTQQKTATDWQVTIETDVQTDISVTLRHKIEKNGIVMTEGTKYLHMSDTIVTELDIHSPLLWNAEQPQLYDLVTELWTEECVERIVTPIGFRTITLSPFEGFIVNGEKSKLKGVCEHHDLGALGAAFNKTALKKRLVLLKEMGVNAIRTAHNMPAKELMTLADEMGFYVVSEGFDMWERQKTEYDYARFFKEWFQKDVASWIKRDRNHPSLIMWSIGNEIYDTHASDRGQTITQLLVAAVLKHDPQKNAAITIGSNYMPWENAQKCADIVKIAGYNYGESYYAEHHERYPDWTIYGSETASVVQSRGIYHFPYAHPILSDDDLQCSALGNSTTSWGARSPEACIIAERDTPFSLGQFIWTGFDYIGEPTPYHTKNSYFGQIDTALFPKDSFYIYQASWTDYKTKPMIHVFPYWDFNPGQIIDVRVATNAPKVRLFLNDLLIGEKEIDHVNGIELVPTFKVAYQPGTLKAIAYDENNRVIAEQERHSFDDPHYINLSPDKKELKAGTDDLIFITVQTTDKNGHIVENAKNRMNISVTGAGRLVGLDNGDSTDYDQYKGTSRRLFSGKVSAIIAATNESGPIGVTVSSKGLASKTIILEAISGYETFSETHYFPENTTRALEIGLEDELPIRKIELSAHEGQSFSPEKRTLSISAQCYPFDASYQKLEWQIVMAGGVPTDIATIEAAPEEVRVTAHGDGQFRIRCTSNNGKNHVDIISELELSAEGLGAAYKNPYDFISGSLYDYHEGNIGNGNERGIATSRESGSFVGYHQINFGKYGSDTIHLPLFALSDAPHQIQIWDGIPYATDSTLLADVLYQKNPIWDVYQSETYHLSKKLTGIKSLYFAFNERIHLKGFSFEKPQRAYQKNHILDADSMYGDTFTKTKDAVEKIGNNVSFVFDNMDFGETGLKRLRICGHSPIDKNTIHIRFQNEFHQLNQLIEFDKSEGYTERIFELDSVTGNQNVHFIFLPGSQFNFKWFKFE